MREYRIWLGALAVLLGTLIFPAFYLTTGQYAALAGGVQAFGVVVALGLASYTLRSDSKDRRVDRTLAFHADLVSGEIHAARVRLVEHLRRNGQNHRVRPTTIDELRNHPRFSAYENDSAHLPAQDANILLRHFERANVARIAGAVHAPLFHELIGRHAVWWVLAIQTDISAHPLQKQLVELANWAEDYARSHPELDYLSPWGGSRRREFGQGSPDDPDSPEAEPA